MLQTILPYVLFAIGFVILIKGADMAIEGASSIAKRFKISNLVIGLTIIAFGTSAPELLVSVTSGLKGSADIAIGNVVGSNIANIVLILGIAGLIYPIKVGHGTAWKEIPFALLGVIMLYVLANDALIDGDSASAITRIDGLVMLGFFSIFLYYVFGISKVKGPEQKDEIKKFGITKSIIFLVLGFTGLILGSDWVVSGAVHIAEVFGLSESLIGLTIVAVGTSLPELAASAVAAYKRNSDIAIGNIVGSNIFNIFFILGTASVITPLSFSPEMDTDIMICLAVTFVLFLALFIGKRGVLERWQSALFVIFYVIYIVYLVMRG